LALRELEIKDWWRVALREIPNGLALGAMLGIVGIVRIRCGNIYASTTTASTGC
jgi:Mg/Co/Ni transporter MgtE